MYVGASSGRSAAAAEPSETVVSDSFTAGELAIGGRRPTSDMTCNMSSLNCTTRSLKSSSWNFKMIASMTWIQWNHAEVRWWIFVDPYATHASADLLILDTIRLQ